MNSKNRHNCSAMMGDLANHLPEFNGEYSMLEKIKATMKREAEIKEKYKNTKKEFNFNLTEEISNLCSTYLMMIDDDSNESVNNQVDDGSSTGEILSDTNIITVLDCGKKKQTTTFQEHCSALKRGVITVKSA